MSDDRGDEDDYEGLRILGSDPAGGPAADDTDDDLPHWSESPADGGTWASPEPRWDDTWAADDPTGGLRLDDLGRGSAGAGEFNPSLLPPDDAGDDYGAPYAADPRGTGPAYAEDPDQFGAVPTVTAEGPPRSRKAQSGGGAARDLPTAIGVAVGLGAIALAAFAISDVVSVVLVAVVLAAAAVEWFNNLRRRGYQPATLLGISACAAMPLAAYWRGPEAVPLVLFLTVVVGALWYLAGVADERPVPNLGVTLYGVVYIGVLGSFAGLMLKAPNGTGMLTAAIIVTVAYDVGGFVVGSAVGRSSLSSVSPNKTIEGLLGGGVAAIVAAVVILNVVGLTPFGEDPGGFAEALSLGVAAAIFAPLGDLTESMLKRDLDLKDMGTLLPGHGGFLDRFDALLFMLPVTYYLVRLYDLF